MKFFVILFIVIIVFSLLLSIKKDLEKDEFIFCIIMSATMLLYMGLSISC